MAVLTANQILQVRSAIHRALSELSLSIGWSKAEVVSEIATVDAFQDLTGDSAINAQFSAGFKAKSSVADRTLLYIAILIRRHLVGHPTHLDVLRRILNNTEAS